MSDLTTAQHQRQNILNNRYALQAAEQHLGLGGLAYAGETVFTKQQVTALFDISDATVERYLAPARRRTQGQRLPAAEGEKSQGIQRVNGCHPHQ